MTEIDEILFSQEELERADKEALSNPLMKKFRALYDYYNSSYVDELSKLQYDVTFRIRELRRAVRDGKLKEENNEVNALIDFIVKIPKIKQGLECLKTIGNDEIIHNGRPETLREKHARLSKSGQA